MNYSPVFEPGIRVVEKFARGKFARTAPKQKRPSGRTAFLRDPGTRRQEAFAAAGFFDRAMAFLRFR
jgi:hypothetical protein